MAALRADRTAHAYLFSGPRGCGKTTSARILARCLNCAQAPTDTPCGECDSCRELSLAGSGSLDVIEMDAASHGGVDDARDLVERASFAPTRDRFKIFIIDEAHMVTNQGFNALLKLVEEPPPHVKFIFATTEPEKVIGTIRSRTHHYPFRLVPPEVLEHFLAEIVAEEGVEAGAGVLPLVVRAGGGSVRDSLSVLDQLIGGSESSTLRYEDAIALLGYTDGSLLDDATEAIAASDGATLFSVVDRVVQSGHDPRRFVEDLLQRLRDIIVIGLSGDSAHDVFRSVPEDQYARMQAQAEHMGAARASHSADLVNDALTLMVGATSPRLQLELLCARLLLPVGGGAPATGTSPAPAQDRVSQAAQRTENAGPVGHSPRKVASSVPAAQAPKRDGAVPVRNKAVNPVQPGKIISPSWAAAVEEPDSGAAKPEGSRQAPSQETRRDTRAETPHEHTQQETHTEKTQENTPQETHAAPPSMDAAMIRQRWNEIVESIRNSGSKSTASLVDANAQIGSFGDGTLTVIFQSNGLARTFNERGHAERVAHALHDVLGVEAVVRGTAGNDTQQPVSQSTAPMQHTAPARGTEPAHQPVRGHERQSPRSTGDNRQADRVPPANQRQQEAASDTDEPPFPDREPPQWQDESIAPWDNTPSERSTSRAAYEGETPDAGDSHAPSVRHMEVTSPTPTNGTETAGSDTRDPAGVLAQILDNPSAGKHVESNIQPTESSTQPEQPGVQPEAPEPFYDQRMPLPPRLEEMRSQDRAANASTSGDFGSLTQRILSSHQASAASPDAPRNGASGKLAPAAPEEDEVSADDPTVEQSRIVGLDVVLETFAGVVLEETSSERGDV